VLPNPYSTPNLIFLGDDTSSAQATLKLAAASVVDAPPFNVYLPLIHTASTVTRLRTCRSGVMFRRISTN